MLKRKIAVAWILSKDEKTLVGKKDPQRGGVYLDKLHQPGGGADEGETMEQALAREVMEEAGIDIKATKISLIDDSQKMQTKKQLPDGSVVDCEMQFYAYLVEIPVEAKNIRLTSSDDLVDLKWIDKDELKATDLTPPAELILEKLGWGSVTQKTYINIDDFAKVELRVGLVKEAIEPEWSNKLIRQVVDFGEEIGMRVIFSGLRKWYSAEEDFVGRKLVYVTNLAPRKMGEEMSEGMILAVEDAEGTPIRWDVTATSIEPGTRVG